MSVERKRYVVPGLERGLMILGLFSRQQRTLGAPGIARSLGLPRSTVFRLLQTLEHMEFLERAANGEYQLGPAILRTGFEYLASLELTELARPVLERLRDRCGAAAQVVVRDGRDAVVILKTSAPSAFASTVQVGTRLPVHATAYGRVLMSDMDGAALKKLFPDGRLPASSSQNAPRSLQSLARLLEQDRARGYVVSESFFERNISAVVAPVRDQHGEIVAATGVTLQQPSLDPALKERLVGHVLKAASELSHRLNYRPVEQAA